MRSRQAISGWPRVTAERWLKSWAHEPALVAESLRGMADPLATVLAPPHTEAVRVAAAIGRALLPPMAAEAPPAWLRPGQVAAFRRTLEAARTHGGALLAEPVGTGKSWVALAAALALEKAPPVILAPAVLLPQWRELLARTGITAECRSHESVSRGRLPRGTSGAVVVDESHWYRNPASRRYRTLAPWLVGRRGILVSATPIVNLPADLAHQLRLLVRDDALAGAGLPSLRRLGPSGDPGLALGEVVVAGWIPEGERPPLTRSLVRVRLERRAAGWLRRIEALRFSPEASVAALVRTTMWRAAASSPAALEAALARYLALLGHAGDAARAGRRVGREALRRFLATDPAQLVLWPMVVQAAESEVDLVPGDRDAVAALRHDVALAAAQTDRKAEHLGALLSDGLRTVVFTGAVATVSYLRRLLGPAPVAWCTGQAAGIGTARQPRDAVLGWFGPSDTEAPAGLRGPRVLVTTDVAAEGLNLQGAGRVVHYDLPWTEIRTRQRTGRVRRLASPHASVAEHWFLPPRSLARRLGIEGALSRKGLLPRRLGVDAGSPAPWRRRVEASCALTGAGGEEGMAVVRWPEGSRWDALACVVISLGKAPPVARLLVHHHALGWRLDDSAGLDLLLALPVREPAAAGRPTDCAVLLEELAAPVRHLLREAAGLAWSAGWQAPGTLAVLRRLRHWARIAARARDPSLLEAIDNALRALARGRTAGDELRLEGLAARVDAQLSEHLQLLSGSPPPFQVPRAHLAGLLLPARPWSSGIPDREEGDTAASPVGEGPGGTPPTGSGARFRPWHPSPPSCSTSTGP